MKNIVIGLFIVLNLHAQTYEELLNRAIEKSLQLKVVQSRQEEVSLQGQIDRRFKNPNLELEIADFSSKFLTQSNEFGVRVGVSQSILLPHIREDKKRIEVREFNVEKERYFVEKSKFIYRFNLKYLAYKDALKKLELYNRVVSISTNLLDAVRSRYQEGAVAKSEFLEMNLKHRDMLNEKEMLDFKLTESKNSLLSFALLSDVVEIDGSYQFRLLDIQKTHSLIKLNQAKERVSQEKLELLRHSLESIEVFSELEREPDQDVFRIGISIDLPTFNLKSEERQLEKIKIANQKLRIAEQEKLLTIQIAQLKYEVSKLKALNDEYRSSILEKKELFEIYKKSYELAKVNFLKLQKTLQNIVTTEEKILENSLSIEESIIKINYLQGGYSE